MEIEVNEEKRNKFMEYASKRVNNVMHDIQILEPMARSNSYDFTKQDVAEMFNAMQETLDNAKEEFYKKFEEKSKSTKKTFSFGNLNFANDNIQEEHTGEEKSNDILEEENVSNLECNI